MTATDPDSAHLQGATASITGELPLADGDSLAFTSTPNITGSYNSGTGVLTLTGTATVANYQTALRSITFSNTSHNPSGDADTLVPGDGHERRTEQRRHAHVTSPRPTTPPW